MNGTLGCYCCYCCCWRCCRCCCRISFLQSEFSSHVICEQKLNYKWSSAGGMRAFLCASFLLFTFSLTQCRNWRASNWKERERAEKKKHQHNDLAVVLSLSSLSCCRLCVCVWMRKLFAVFRDTTFQVLRVNMTFLIHFTIYGCNIQQ